MLGITTTASGFSGAVNVLASRISPRWAIGGDRSARRVEKLRARLDWGAYGTVPIKPRGMHERTYQRILRVLPITRPCERRGRVMLESTNHESTLPIYGGNAEIDLLSLAVGQFGGADNFR